MGRGVGGQEYSNYRDQLCKGPVAGMCSEHWKNRRKLCVLGRVTGRWRGWN